MGFTFGALQAGLSAAFEEKPDVPEFQWIDLVQKQLETAEGNLEVLPITEKIGTRANEFMRGERAKTLAGIPGLEDIETQTVENLKGWLRGELGDDLSSSVQRRSNAQAFAGGYGGSGMARNLEARDLGLTGLQLQQSAIPLGGSYLSGATARRAIPEFNPATMFIDPMAAAQFDAQQNQSKWQRDWLREQIKAQPEPWQQSLMDSAASLSAFGDQVLGTYVGGVAGGGMGGMGGGAGGAIPASQQAAMQNEFYGYGAPGTFSSPPPPSYGGWGGYYGGTASAPPPAYDPYNYSW